MFHERELFVSGNAHEQCNGFRLRRWYSHGFEFSLRIPRSRSGNFYPVLLGLIRNESEERARLFWPPLHQGVTTEQIGEISDCVYGRAYSKQQVSHLAGSCRDDVERWLGRSLSSHNLAVYIDATFISTRRDRQVSKEAYYTILGGEDGSREVLTVVNHPTEGALCWKDELEALRQRGVGQIDLVVSDALQGIENAVCAAFPGSAHQFCVAHVKRQILGSVSHKDKLAVAQQLSEVFPLENNEMKSFEGYEEFITFVEKWESKYPALRRYKAERNSAYFTYMDFPAQVQRCIYTTNWIERLNRKYKRTINMRTSMPSEKSVIFLLAAVAMEETKTTYGRRIYQFKSWKEKNKKAVEVQRKER
ncbi:Transposase and inactivated derivatives [Prevotella intermedia]|nr:Transposase and inactivated derivatives [Prevotella intermedia]